MRDEIHIRFAEPDDAEELLRIYAPYVLRTAVTFEYDVPSVAEFSERIQKTQQMYPYLVAECQNEVVGYAYAEQFKNRAAYDWTVETSIYVKQGMGKRGIGKKLYERLETLLKEMNIYSVNACIAYPAEEDEYLTRNSVEFHRHMGYTLVGEFHTCGYKFGRWYNMVWMEKMIAEHPAVPAAIVPISEVRQQEHTI